jgi:hypothetical protein
MFTKHGTRKSHYKYKIFTLTNNQQKRKLGEKKMLLFAYTHIYILAYIYTYILSKISMNFRK